MRNCIRLAILWLLLSLLGSFAAAQSTTSLRGVISDAKGALLPGATVKINDLQTGFSRIVTSGQDGVYQFLQIPPATYTVTVVAAGFVAIKREHVTLQVNTPATLNFTAQVEGAKVQVEVTSEAPVVNTQDASIGNAFNERQLLDLPSEGRDPVAILSLQPGVTYIGSQVDQTNDSRGGSVSGARSDQTNITWDGLDDNDQLQGNAFQGALRATLDSLQEFRVTTSNGNADEGRSSGAQVSLVTKSGTNALHGSVYEYNRSSLGEANDWFNEAAEIRQGLPNQPPQLIRNTFGATFGGPIQKDRLFYFLAYEGQRTRETVQTTQVVPSAELRQGMIQYPCDSAPVDPNCTLGSPNADHFTVVADPRVGAGQYLAELTPAQFAAMDPHCTANGTCPLGPGADPAVLSVFQQYPQPNTDTVGDLLNLRGFTFPGAQPQKLNNYIAKLDYKLTANGNQSLFLRGNLLNDNESIPPQFPGDPPSYFDTNNSKGIFVGYTAVLRPNLINNFRWGFIRQGTGTAGLESQPYVYFRTIATLNAFTQSEFVNVPVNNFVDDITWTKGKHTLQFGTNLRLVHNNRLGNMQNVSNAGTDPFSLDNASIANASGPDSFCTPNPSKCSLDPLGFPSKKYPVVDSAFGESYDFAATAMAGLVTVDNQFYNQNKESTAVAPGALIPRHFKAWEAEWYAQDSWRVTPYLVVTGGLRYTLLEPPYETTGNQAAPTISVGNLFAQRAQAQQLGQAYSPGQNAVNGVAGGLPPITFDTSGPANGGKPYWDWDYRNFAPRLAIAYSPHADSGWLRSVFGGVGKSSIRLGYGLYYDHFGEGMVNTFDRNGSFGLTTTETNPYGYQDVDCSDRFTGLFNLPQGVYCGQDMAGAPPGPFPVTPPSGVNAPGGFAIYWGMDDKLKTPYSHAFDFSLTRDLGRNFSLEVAYVGRLGRHLLQETDLGMPEDIRDPKSGLDYFGAATMFAKLANAGTDYTQVAPIPYWENLFPSAAGGGLTATQSMYQLFQANLDDEIVALQYADTTCFPACATLAGQSAPTPYNFFMPQFSSLWGWRTSGNSSYNALNVTLRHAFAAGVEFDVNYTFSKSIDVGSNAERINVFDVNGANVGGFSSQVINAWQPNQLRAVSDFDMQHQINSNWIAELPFGRGHKFGSGMGRVPNALFGGWSVSGLFHWTTGLPFSIFPGGGWSTNYNLEGEAIEIANPGPVGVHINTQGNPTMFANPTAAIADFRHPYPGEGGERNELRGPGYFGIDTGLGKEWKIREDQVVKFDWEVFNATNAVRFDAANASNSFDLTSSTNFGVYNSTLTKPRVMQFSLRFGF
jgi:Carboxypeptidase regulatory-like domain